MKNKFSRLAQYNFPKDILANRDWYEKSWAGVLFSLYAIGQGCVYLINKRVPDTFRISITFVKNDHMSWLWDMRDMKRIRARILILIKKRPKVIAGYLRSWRKDWAKFKAVTASLEKADLRDLSDKALYNEYLKLRDAYAAANSVAYLVDSFLTSGASDWLAELITAELRGKVSSSEITSCIVRLTAPTINSFSSRELIDLLRIAVKFKRQRSQKVLALDLKKHAQRYYWIENSYYPKESLTEQYFRTKLNSLLKSGRLSERLREESGRAKRNERQKQRLFKKLHLSPDLQKVIKAASVFTAWQDDRKSNVFIVNHFFFLILCEIGHRVGLTPFEMYYTIDHELPDILFKKKFDRRRLQARRKQGCLFVNTPRGIYLMEGKEAKKYSKESFLGLNETVRELKGVAASPGFVKGKVRVVVKIEDFQKFQTGEILVTNNTTPDFVPIMKKAAAIITEQGGITSHAAIVSRELGTPCVIGTKIATKVLHDGDIVEVDANKGIIRI